MKREEEKPKTLTTSSRPDQKTDVTSSSVENAHATGDGAVKKSDELLPADDDEETSTDTAPY